MSARAPLDAKKTQRNVTRQPFFFPKPIHSGSGADSPDADSFRANTNADHLHLQSLGDADGWTTCVDESTGESYYWNTITNQVTWSNPYAAPHDKDDHAPTTTRALPGSAPTASHSHASYHHSAATTDTDDLSAIHPSRRAFFSGGSPEPVSSHSSSSMHPPSATTNYNATAASHLDLLLHSIDRAKAGDTQSLVDTVSSEKSLSSAMTAAASSIRPTAVTGGPGASPLPMPDYASSGYGYGYSGGADDTDGATAGPSAKSLNNLYFDEQAYQDQRNMDKAMEAVYGKEKRKRLSKSELEQYKVKKEQQKKKKYLSKFENL